MASKNLQLATCHLQQETIMSAFTTHFSFEFKTGIRNKNLLLMNYLFPLGFFLMMGAIMPAINPYFRETMIPAMVTFAILASTLLGLPDPLVNARENGIFRSYKINGVPAFSILLIPALTTALHLTIVTIIIVATAPLFFAAQTPINWLPFAATAAAMLLACTGIGVLIGVVSPSTRMTVLYSQIIFVPAMILGGLMMPYRMLPAAARMIAQLLPASHAMNGFNGLAMGAVADFNPWASLAALAATGLIAFALALFLFSWDSKNSKRRGHPAMALLALVPFVALIFLAPTVTIPDSVDKLAEPIDFGGYFELVAVETAVSDDELLVDLWWQAETAVGQDYIVFVYALDENGELVAQSDTFPGQGTNPTRLWQDGDITHDQHQLTIPADEVVTVLVGAYDPNTQERLTATVASTPLADNAWVKELSE